MPAPRDGVKAVRLAEVTTRDQAHGDNPAGQTEKAWPGRQKERQGAGVLDAKWRKCPRKGVSPWVTWYQ